MSEQKQRILLARNVTFIFRKIVSKMYRFENRRNFFPNSFVKRNCETFYLRCRTIYRTVLLLYFSSMLSFFLFFFILLEFGIVSQI